MSSQTTVLARKWRPAQFSEIVGQSHIVRTLSNALASGRIHQAYLFTGSRGIGKTTIARIFAKALRCENLTAPTEAKPWLKTCDECANCREITQGSSVDVLEIDGASNNGVDAVREIRDNAKYLPASGTRKIYIIDEVHMLTTAAFNALLKTLEEPPPHVIFVFATTEPHKIPATILSRCQRFDFKRATDAQLLELLTRVAKTEGIQAEPAALASIARAAEGGMRDALSLLDQSIAYAGKKISAESVREAVGLVGADLIFRTLEAVLQGAAAQSITLISGAYDQGQDLKTVTRGLLELLHAVILAKAGVQRQDVASLAFSDEEWTRVKSLAATRELSDLEYLFQVLHQAVEWVARSPQPKAVLDIALVKCASAGSTTHASVATSFPPAQPQPTQKTQATAQTAPPTPKPPVNSAQPLTNRTWEGLIAHVKQSRKFLGSILEHGQPGALPGPSGGNLEISFAAENDYYREQLGAKAYSEQLQAVVTDYFGAPVRVRLSVSGADAPTETLASRRERETQVKEDQIRSHVLNNATINEARSLFGARLGPIEIT